MRTIMKRLFYLLLLLMGTTHTLHAQNENGTKDFGGFILDMGTMLNAESLTLAPLLPTLTYMPELGNGLNLPQINPDALKINTQGIIYGAGTPSGMRTGILSLYHPGYGNGPVTWQSATYRLNNGARINLYGEYDADGNKVYNPSALPWQRNNFNAAFEVKSPDGKFGVKFEVSGGRTGY